MNAPEFANETRAHQATAQQATTCRPNRTIDVIALGETMAVVTPVANESLEHAQLCHLSIGGAESNVLIQLARSGLRTRLISCVGDDSLGRRTVRTIAARRSGRATPSPPATSPRLSPGHPVSND